MPVFFRLIVRLKLVEDVEREMRKEVDNGSVPPVSRLLRQFPFGRRSLTFHCEAASR